MKRCISFLSIGTILLTAFGSAQPKLSLGKPEINLGSIYSGASKKGTIVLTNIGNDTLRIFSVQPSCGCTTVKQPKKYLLPFESDAAEVEFNSSGYLGRVEKHITISTNDPLSREVSVKLISEVKLELEPVDRSVIMWFGNIVIGVPASKEIILRNVSGHQINVKDITVSSPAISIGTKKKILNPDETISIQVTVNPERSGYVAGHFIIETDSKDQPREEIRVSYIGVKEN